MFQIGEAKAKIAELNEKLQEKCSISLRENSSENLKGNTQSETLALELDFYSQFKDRDNLSINEDMINPHIVLCLNKMPENHCISSIACKINKADKTMEISSKTHTSHEGKKYNTLLRSAIMYAAKYIKYKIGESKSRRKSKSKSKTKGKTKSKTKSKSGLLRVTKIISRSINPISTLLLVKYFGATNDDLDEFIDENDYDRATITLDQIKEFQQESTEDMTSSEELEYMENNENFGEPLLLNVNLLDPDVAEKIQDTFDSTLKKMSC
jgi:hypothetical protein